MRTRTRRAQMGAARDGSRHPAVWRHDVRRTRPQAAATRSAQAAVHVGPRGRDRAGAGASHGRAHAGCTVARDADDAAGAFDAGGRTGVERGVAVTALDAAPAVHGEHLPGDVRRLDREKVRGPRDVVGRARALQRRLADDLGLQAGVDAAFGPEHGTGRDGVHAHVGAELARQRLRQHDQARLGRGIDGMRLQRPHAMDIRQVDDQAAALAQGRGGRLRQEQRGPQVGADEIVELRRRDRADRGGHEARRVVDQDVEPPEPRQRAVDERLQALDDEQIAREGGGRVRAHGVEFSDERVGFVTRGAVVHRYERAASVQFAHDGFAQPARAARDERAASSQWAGRGGLGHVDGVRFTDVAWRARRDSRGCAPHGRRYLSLFGLSA